MSEDTFDGYEDEKVASIDMDPADNVDIDEIRPNAWNPNELDPDMFNSLVENISDIGFVQPIIVAPLVDDVDGYKYRIIDGEHRFEAAKLLGMDQIPAYLRDIDDDDQKFQTVKMNRLRGAFNQKKFSVLVRDLMERHSFEEVAESMAFTDPTELEMMIDNARDSLPTKEMQDAFDQAKDEIKTVDDLSLILNRLFTRFGDTLPYNFMVLDFGGKEHLWVRMQPHMYRHILAKARDCMEEEITFDSVVMSLLMATDLKQYITEFPEDLVKAESENTSDSIDDLLE